MALRTIYAPFNPQIQIKDSSGGLHVPWHAREKITTWNFMGPTSQTTTPFLGLQNQRSTWVTARGAVESAAEYYLSNCWLQFRHNRGTGCCYAVEEGTGQHKVNVSLGLQEKALQRLLLKPVPCPSEFMSSSWIPVL